MNTKNFKVKSQEGWLEEIRKDLPDATDDEAREVYESMKKDGLLVTGTPSQISDARRKGLLKLRKKKAKENRHKYFEAKNNRLNEKQKKLRKKSKAARKARRKSR